MLPCQHTFCYSCLQKQLMVRDLLQVKRNVPADSKATLLCCLCQRKTELENGTVSLENLPKNLHIESLLKIMEEDLSPRTPKPIDYRCVKCQTVSEQQEHICQHCMQVRISDSQEYQTIRICGTNTVYEMYISAHSLHVIICK